MRVNLSEVEFELKPVEEKPSRKYHKKSKYDPIIDEFIEMDEDLVKVEIEDKEANYLRTQLKKRIDTRELQDELDVAVVNGVCYIEKK
jgi:seryl-tRNA synthetase